MKNSFLYILTFFFLVFACFTGNGQANSSYSIIVAGHAYGAHAGTNLGLHPPFLSALRANIDSNVSMIFLTGDIVNHSTVESWNQVEKELDSLGLDSYYVMGNHDNNSVGLNVFQKKYGGTYYNFSFGNELFIVLNSTESDRSISPSQLDFLNEVLANTDSNQNRIFIFFHEVIWNSNEKYRLVRSNSRSRYDEVIGHSNFWEDVFPMLTAYPEKEFYLFAGDVGGNPDAITASYDKWGNVTLLSSGMGEVADENYLKVDILSDTVEFRLIPLRDDVIMKPVTWYNIPGKPEQIEGPEKISPLQQDVKFQALPVFNATAYHWTISNGINGNSDSVSIFLSFDKDFQEGEIKVSAVNDGFGESEPAVLEIKSDTITSYMENKNTFEFFIHQNEQTVFINCISENSETAHLRIYNSLGQLFFSDEFQLNPGLNTKNIEKHLLRNELVIFELTSGMKRKIQKIYLY